MPEVLKKYVIGSIVAHVVILLVMAFSDAFQFSMPRSEKVTYVKLSFGDGGTNTKANPKKIQGLPAATIRDQKEALKQLAKLKELPKEKTDKPPPLNTKYGKETAQPPVNRKTVKIGGGATPATPPRQLSKADDALARINDKLKVREEQFKQIEIGSGQAKDGETGQSAWGGAEGTALDPALIAYYNTLKRKITNEWLLSKDKFSGTLIAKIEVLIDAQGHIVRTSYAQTSGDGSFDDSALRAVKKVSPFPIPPASIRDEALSEGFTFTFNPSSVSGTVAGN